ncbi:MAG: FTR1 family protein [Chloroflexi bacterium]|nr:FTR1 family protein [Chloroflexota bacterium]
MIAAFLITLREGLEAALIVGIVLSVLHRLGATQRRHAVWAGVVAAIIVSLVVALAFNALGIVFAGRGEEIFEGLAMILAAGVLTWMVYWMRKQGHQVQAGIEADTTRAVEAGDDRLLFGLAFVAVVREGIETALFLTAAAFQATVADTLVGALFGLVAAIALGWLIFVAGKRINLRLLFDLTGILLLLFAAGLLAHGVHELQEATLLPTIIDHVWDINPILDESEGVGSLLASLFGYNGNPSLLEIIVYGLYLVAVPIVVQSLLRQSARSSTS